MKLDVNLRFKDYEKLLIEAKANLDRSRKKKWQLDGFCYMIKKIRQDATIYDYDELLKYKPNHIKKPDTEAWFSGNANGPDSEKRIKIIEEILKSK